VSQFRIPTIPSATAAINSMSWPRRGFLADAEVAVLGCETSGGSSLSWSIMLHAFSLFRMAYPRRF
jgi:hypothetical protein